MTEHNINESMINDNPEDKLASDEAAEKAHEPTEDLENAPVDDDKLTPEKLGEAAIKFATETAYAAAGFAGLVGDKAKAFYDEQKKQYVEAHPDEDKTKSNSFLDQLSEQLNRFADDLSRGYRDMADRGRDVVKGNTAAKRGPADDAAAAEGTSTSPVNDGESPASENATTFSSNLSEDVSEKAPGSDDVLPDSGKQDGIL